MSTGPRARRRAAADAAPSSAPTAFDLMADSAREQFAMCMEASGAALRCLDAMRAIHLRSMQEASARHRAAARRLQDAAGAGEAMAMPWTLWEDELAAASRYWQELSAAALEAQTEALGCACCHLFDSESTLHGAAAMEALEALPAMRTLMDGGAAIARHALPR